MKLNGTLITVTTGLLLALSASAQEDGSEIILPVEAQNCNLPTAPARIPDEATYDDLADAKQNVSDFQTELTDYRTCLDASQDSEALTDGNRIALGQAHNYSVEMEERVAEQFNAAVRAYKARQAEGGE